MNVSETLIGTEENRSETLVVTKKVDGQRSAEMMMFSAWG